LSSLVESLYFVEGVAGNYRYYEGVVEQVVWQNKILRLLAERENGINRYTIKFAKP